MTVVGHKRSELAHIDSLTCHLVRQDGHVSVFNQCAKCFNLIRLRLRLHAEKSSAMFKAVARDLLCILRLALKHSISYGLPCSKATPHLPYNLQARMLRR